MSQTLTFTKVFTAEGTSSKGAWTRWDFRTADGDRYSTFDEGVANQVLLNVPVEVEIAVSPGKNGHVNKTVFAVLSGSKAEAGQQSSEGQEAVRTAPMASQRVSDDARGKTRAIIAAQLAPALFNSLPPDEQSLEAGLQIAEALVDYAFQG